MKKNILKIGLSFLFAAFLVSCEEDTVTYSGSDFVLFNSITEVDMSASEASGAVNIPVNITKPQPNDVVVNFTVTSTTATAGVDYNVTGSSVTIPAGATSANIVINLIDNDAFDTMRVLEIELTSASAPVTVGLTEVGSYTKRLSIVNDDCPTKFVFWVGSVTVEDVGYGTTPGSAGANANGDCDILVVNNNLPGEAAPAAPATLNTIYNLVFTPSNEDGSAGTVEVAPTLVRQRNFSSGGVVSAYDMKYTAFGTYDTTTGEIVLEYSYGIYSASGVFLQDYYTGTNIITVN
ncbi:MAG: Calx-beta domain-containing protein [Flavobacterium sp.]